MHHAPLEKDLLAIHVVFRDHSELVVAQLLI